MDLREQTNHIDLLDGLRGIAALSVVVFHFMEWVYPDFDRNFIGHGFLAVDFFYCLSGFVIAYAYDRRFPRMPLRDFFVRRLIRLHPLVVLGGLLGLLAFLLDPFADPGAAGYSAWQIVLLLFATLLMIPYPAMEDRAFNLFGLNAPAWTLFWEYVANVVYALLLVRLGRRPIGVLLGVAALVLLYVAYTAGNLVGGWNGETFWHGGARVAYSFLAGLLIFRNSWTIRNRLGFPVLAILLLAALTAPHIEANWLIELVIVMVYFPLLVALGAGSLRQHETERLCRISGDLSYPLYITHYFVLWIYGNWFVQTEPEQPVLYMVIGLATVLVVAVAYVVFRWYDKPVRRYLTERMNRR